MVPPERHCSDLGGDGALSRLAVFGLITACVTIVTTLTVSAQGADRQTPASARGTCLLRRALGIELTSLQRGQALYRDNCAPCHGTTGNGAGPGSVHVFPKPRDFTSGLFKLHSTRQVPTDADLRRVLTDGMPGTSMPAFRHLTEPERDDLVGYVKLLAVSVRDGTRVAVFEEAAAQPESLKPVPIPDPPPRTEARLEAGQQAFAKQKCDSCHGVDGSGTGPASVGLRDSWGYSIHPRDFRTGVFISGGGLRELYQRILLGVGGTPMLAYPDGILKPEERWGLVYFVQRLAQSPRKMEGPGPLVPPPGGWVVHARRSTGTTSNELTGGWSLADTLELPLQPLWPAATVARSVRVAARHDGHRLALRLEWDAPQPSQGAWRVQEYHDSAAVQFSLTDPPGFLGMGDSLHPVNIWQWKPERFLPAGTGSAMMLAAYPLMKTDMADNRGPQYLTASAVGNPVASQAASPRIEDANASGFGTLTVQDPARQNVTGAAAWTDGRRAVVLMRELTPRDTREADLRPQRRVPFAVAIWNGANRDRNGQKSVTTWHHLEIDP